VFLLQQSPGVWACLWCFELVVMAFGRSVVVMQHLFNLLIIWLS